MARVRGKFRDVPKPALPVLKRMVADTKDIDLLTMFWAIHAIQEDRAEFVKKNTFTYPPEAATSDMMSPYAAYPWDLETLITQTLNEPKSNLLPWKMRPLNTGDYNGVADIVNTLRAVEDDQSADRLDGSNIMLEMHRIGHRQFQWQTGFQRPVDIYRYLYIYGQGACADFFEETNGISITDFVTICFVLWSTHGTIPWTKKLNGLAQIGMDDALIDKVLPLVSGEIWTVRRESLALLQKVEKGLGVSLPVIYQPSYLRVKPLLRSGTYNTYIAPLPSLLLLRATVGLYYDIVKGGNPILGDANARFEAYARMSLVTYCPGFEAAPAVKYTVKRNPVETPDVLLKQEGRIVAVFECKATKLTFEAQYGDDPVENASGGYEQMAKAVFQLWKFFAHVRLGLVELNVVDDACAVVLTMDAWTQMSSELQARIIKQAEELAAAKSPEIEAEDKRHPIFCSIQDLDELLLMSNEEHLLGAFKAARLDKYIGWGVRQVREREFPALEERKKFAFDLEGLFPWWGKFKDRAPPADAAE
ncbi:hypothetical protein C8J32_10923 [Rhizobium sp. PP-CC-3A-592]|nr:hypothetical protein C8J32_10923 [Rhizobium sp. PP-CC-3A-592]